MFIPTVVEDNPSADYDTITKLVQEKWSRLSDTNKQHFCMVGKDELEVLKKTVIEKKKLSQKIRRKSAEQVGRIKCTSLWLLTTLTICYYPSKSHK